VSVPAHVARGVVEDGPRLLLRLEGAALVVLSVLIYARRDGGWLRFFLLFLAPDVSFLAYTLGPRAGAAIYNALHTLLGPAALTLVGVLRDNKTAVAVALVWFAHVGMDRALGYGLKYADRFGHTHLGVIGGRPDRRAPRRA